MMTLEETIQTQLAALSYVVQSKLNGNVLPYEVKNIADYDNDLVMQFHLPLLLVELQIDLESIKKSNKPTFICCLPVEIDEMDNLVSPTHGHLSDWDFEAWLEQDALKTEVLSVGSVTHEGRRFRMFKWLVQGPPESNQKTSNNVNCDGVLLDKKGAAQMQQTTFECTQCKCQFLSVPDNIVIMIPCPSCGGKVQYAKNPSQPYENHDLTGILDAGIQAKRAGNIQKAIDLYKEAQRLDPNDRRPYGNLARVYTGFGRYTEALRNWLMICENNRINPTAGAEAYEMMMSRYEGHSLKWGDSIIDSKLIRQLISNSSVLKDCVFRSDNLTFYIGHCVVNSQQSKLEGQLPQIQMKSLEASLMGQLPQTGDLRDSEWEYVFLFAGLVFVQR